MYIDTRALLCPSGYWAYYLQTFTGSAPRLSRKQLGKVGTIEVTLTGNTPHAPLPSPEPLFGGVLSIAQSKNVRGEVGEGRRKAGMSSLFRHY
jgi:hypothetical protein